jgi:hypothetical protein
LVNFQVSELQMLQAAAEANRLECERGEAVTVHQAAVEASHLECAKGDAGTMLEATEEEKLLKRLRAKNSNVPSCVEGSTGKYEIHLNVSNLLGCFFNFGPGSNSSTFPLGKKD